MFPSVKLLFAASALSLAAFATSASATTVNFTGIAGSNNSDFSSYTESGFTVTATGGSVFVDTSTGDPAPDIWAHNGTVTVTTTGDFTFTGVDLEDPPPAEDFTITGYLNGNQVFTTNGVLSDSFVLYGSAYSADTINSLTIALNSTDGNSSSGYIDNIGVNAVAGAATPEPSSLILIGTGLLGIGAMARRKLAL